MKSFEELGGKLHKYIKMFCPPIHSVIFSEYQEKRKLKMCLGFISGFGLGQVYYHFLLQKIPFPKYVGDCVAVIISLILGIGNAISYQWRCISLLLFPMYCGKAGRGLLKAVILTYVISGPITNLGLNAKEVVRVFACTNELSYNLSVTKYTLMAYPFKRALLGFGTEIRQMKNSLRTIRKVFAPFRSEFENTEDLELLKLELDSMDDALGNKRLSDDIEEKYRIKPSDKEEDIYQKNYEKRMEYRCRNHVAKGAETCLNTFTAAYERCMNAVTDHQKEVCEHLRPKKHCVIAEVDLCDATKQVNPGVGEGYAYLKKSHEHLMDNLNDVGLQYRVYSDPDMKVFQDAKETGLRVLHAFEEKNTLMRLAHNIVNICLALLSLRLFVASVHYHEMYLTSIEYDNLYVTRYFKDIDERRKERGKYTLLPLKKMERNRYVDIHSINNLSVEEHKVVNRVLKVMLEMITATTFVMLDRLFYEALEVVRQHAGSGNGKSGGDDLDINLEGIGAVASMLRRVILSFKTHARIKNSVTNEPCVPRPRALPAAFYLKIYGGYLWVVLLLYVNSYTLRLRRITCSYFYPRREKRRILHLYNDILKKRLKINKTLRKKAVQAVRDYYLSGETLLSIRLRYPGALGWLRVLPAARMKCLICGETEPRNANTLWHTCSIPKCPFVYCEECWREVDGVCLACDPSLAELSDMDSLSEDEVPWF